MVTDREACCDYNASYYIALHEDKSMSMTSVRMPDELMARLEQAAADLQRSKGWIINHAVQEFVEREELRQRRLAASRQALAEAEAGEVVDGESVMDWLKSWGSENEQAPPK